jgi:hypothetical protein
LMDTQWLMSIMHKINVHPDSDLAALS